MGKDWKDELICVHSASQSHISRGIWFSVITATLCLIFVEKAILDPFPA